MVLNLFGMVWNLNSKPRAPQHLGVANTSKGVQCGMGQPGIQMINNITRTDHLEPKMVMLLIDLSNRLGTISISIKLHFSCDCHI